MFSLFLTVFLAMAGFSVLLPPVIFAVKNLGVSPAVATLVLAGYSTAAFLTGPYWGRLSDRIGRRPVLVLTLFLAGIAYGALTVFSENLFVVFLTLFVAGAMAGNMSVLFAAVADRTTPEKRAKGMGMIGAGIGLAFTIGPGIGGYLGGASAADATLVAPAMISTGACLLAAVIIFAMFKDVSDEGREPAVSMTRMEAFANIRSRPVILALVLLAFAFTFSLALMEPTLPLLLEHRFQWGPREVGRIFLLVGLILIFVQGGLIGPLTRLYGEWKIAQIGMASMVLGLATIALATNDAMLVVGVALAAIGSALNHASMAALTSRRAGAHERGHVMGTFQSFQALGRALGPIFAGIGFQAFEALPMLVGALIVAVALVRLRGLEGRANSVGETA